MRAEAPWLIDVPAGWASVPLRHLADVETGSADTQDADPDGEYPFVVRSPRLLAIDHFTHDCEAILTPGDGDVGRVFHHLNGKFAAHQRVYVLSNFRGITGRFAYYAFSSTFRHVTDSGTAKSTVESLRRPMLTSFPLPVPPPDTQGVIAEFLDRETAKIDALIAKQEELGRAVREHLHGVQDGLVSLSEGGVRFKYLVDEVDCRAGAAWERLPLLSVSIHWGVRRRDEVTVDLPRAEDLSNYKVVESGDIVVNRMRAFQGALGRSSIDGIVSPDYLVLRAAANVKSDWLAAAMRTPEFISEMAARVRGIGSAELGTVRTPRINADELGEIRLDVPTPPEQEARYITRQRSESQAAVLLERISSLTDAMKERRAALITAAVTGRLDVTTYGKAG